MPNKEVLVILTEDHQESLAMYRGSQYTVQKHPVTEQPYQQPIYADDEALLQHQFETFMDQVTHVFPPKSQEALRLEIKEKQAQLKESSRPEVKRVSLTPGGSQDGSSLDGVSVDATVKATQSK